MHAYGNGMAMTGSQIPQQQQQQQQGQQQQQQQAQQQQQQQQNQVNSSKLSSSGSASPSGYSSYFGGPIPNGGSADNNVMCRPVHWNEIVISRQNFRFDEQLLRLPCDNQDRVHFHCKKTSVNKQ